jgi:diguanylate cyclase (GGDEF)-like protein
VTQTWNIFLLEDDDADKMLVQVSLRHSGIPVNLVHARTLSEAKSLLDSPGFPTMDCALLDRTVPGGSGLDLLNHQKLAGVPCIMLTGYEDEKVAIQALQMGLEDYLIKNEINRHVLVKAIRYAIERNGIKKALAEANKKLEELVRMDPLTGVMNRRGLEELMSRLLARNGIAEQKHGVILVDLDNFKGINDNYGYDAGDAALKFVASKLRLVSRPLDIVARIGGDEFLILVQDVELDQCVTIAERIRGTLEETLLNIGSHEITVTASIGVAPLNGARSVDDLLKVTQNSLHQSKKLGKNTVCVRQATLPPGD